MITSRDVVIVNVVYDEDEHVLETYTSEYRNLMTLLCDKIYVDSFGDCGGMGRCATCAVEIIESNKPLPKSDRNEEATLSKSGTTFFHSVQTY